MGPFLFFTALGLFFLGLALFGRQPGRARDTFRKLYLDEGFLVPIRMLMFNAPFLGAGMLAMGLSILLPRYYAAWLVGAGVSVGAVALVLSYRPPQGLIPQWFREELASGRLPPIRTDFIDRSYFLFWLVLAILGPPAFVVLIVVYGAAGSPP